MQSSFKGLMKTAKTLFLFLCLFFVSCPSSNPCLSLVYSLALAFTIITDNITYIQLYNKLYHKNIVWLVRSLYNKKANILNWQIPANKINIIALLKAKII